ncbi:MAG: molecular chaperone TorD family protein [Coriobacteriales bacterium]|jgi:TorA maturation chaperone TorD|nr:molecular chaperone TorD family protein [Coriobacteriales bacterium]
MESEQTQLLDEAAVTFAALGMLLYQEPTPERTALLIDEDFFAGVPFADDDPQTAQGLTLLKRWTDEARELDLIGVTSELKREWLRLLVGFGEPLAPPWAAYYFEKDPVIFGSKTLEVRSWYTRYGLELERKYHEPDDHLGLMLQFLALLITRESEAHKADDLGEVARLMQEQHDFFEAALLPWVPHWQTLVAAEAKSLFYAGLALLIEGALRTYMLRF